MGFKRTSEGRVFFQSGGKDTGLKQREPEMDQQAPRPNSQSGGMYQDNAPVLQGAPAGYSSNTMQTQILTLLKSLNERLRVSQSEREYLRGEVETYKGLVQDLRYKADHQEKAHEALLKRIEEGMDTGKKSDVLEKLARETFRELEETRKILAELEEKNDRTEHEMKLQIAQVRQSETMLKKKQAELENLQVVQQADIAERLDSKQKQISDAQTQKWNAIMAQIEKREGAVETRLALTESKVQSYDEKIEEAASRAEKLDRKIEKAMQERMRFVRKLERIEETVIQTHEALNSQAMVLLTDRNMAAQSGYPQSPALADADAQQQPGPAAQPRAQSDIAGPWWTRSLKLDALTGSAVVVAALLCGWLLASAGRPDFMRFSVPEITMPSLPELAEIEPAASDEQDAALDFLAADSDNSAAAQDFEDRSPTAQEMEQEASEPQADDPALNAPVSESEEAAIDKVIDDFIDGTAQDSEETNDIGAATLTEKEKILQILEESPDQLAARLNAIEPGAPTGDSPALDLTEPVSAPLKDPAQMSPAPAPAKPDFDFTVVQRITPDAALPPSVKDIEAQAYNGSPEAQHDLAAIYTAGHAGVKQDYRRAADWFREASKNGIANASYNLGVLYHQGIGVGQDLDEAMIWYQKAAERGHPEAQYNLGIASIEGIGMPYDAQKAATYFRNAANAGIMEAAYNLGLIYENGLLGTAKPDEALLWYKTAADQGSPEAKAALEQLAKALNMKIEEVNRIVEAMKKANAG